MGSGVNIPALLVDLATLLGGRFLAWTVPRRLGWANILSAVGIFLLPSFPSYLPMMMDDQPEVFSGQSKTVKLTSPTSRDRTRAGRQI